MFLDNAPGKKINGLIFVALHIKMLNEAVFELIGVGQSGVVVEADKILEIVDTGDIAIREKRIDGVLVAMMRRGPVEKSFESCRSKLDCELPSIAID